MTPLMWLFFAVCTAEPVRPLTQPGSWLCQTSVWPRIAMLWLCAWLTIASAAPKLNDPWDDSVASHFISFSGVTPGYSLSRGRAYWASPRWLLATAAPNVLPFAAAAPPSPPAALDAGA